MPGTRNGNNSCWKFEHLGLRTMKIPTRIRGSLPWNYFSEMKPNVWLRIRSKNLNYLNRIKNYNKSQFKIYLFSPSVIYKHISTWWWAGNKVFYICSVPLECACRLPTLYTLRERIHLKNRKALHYLLWIKLCLHRNSLLARLPYSKTAVY